MSQESSQTNYKKSNELSFQYTYDILDYIVKENSTHKSMILKCYRYCHDYLKAIEMTLPYLNYTFIPQQYIPHQTKETKELRLLYDDDDEYFDEKYQKLNSLLFYTYRSIPILYQYSKLYHQLIETFEKEEDYNELIPMILTERIIPSIDDIESLSSIDELFQILSSCDFWGTKSLPIVVYDYLIHCSDLRIVSMLEHHRVLNIVQQYHLHEISNDLIENIHIAIKDGNLSFLKLLFSKKYFQSSFLYKSHGLCTYAIKEKQLSCLQYLRQQGCEWGEEAMALASRQGNFTIVKYLYELSCPWSRDVCTNAASIGSLECLVYAHQHGCPWDIQTTIIAAEKGHLTCLQYAVENHCPISTIVYYNAVKVGNLASMIYLHEQLHIPWDEYVCSFSAMSGHFNCLRYAHENSCPWNEMTPYEAARSGHLTCLRYAIERHCPINKETCLNIAQRLQRHECVEFLQTFIES